MCPLLLVYLRRPLALVLFHILLDVFEILPSYSSTLLSVASITARFPSSRGLQMLLITGTKALSQPASVHLARPAWAVTPTSDLDPITRPGQVPSLFNSQQITWWHNDTHSLSSLWAQQWISAPQRRLVSHLSWPVSAIISNITYFTLKINCC